jgi:Protein of unknown function (DUF1036)
MSLVFTSQYPAPIWIAFLYSDAGCGGTPFRKLGWWQVNPGENFVAWNTDLRTVNRYAAFYAEEFKDSGGATWSGTGNSWYRISDVGFNQCYDDNTNCNQQPDFIQLDFKKADNGNADFIDLSITLGPGQGQLSIIGSVPID